MADKMSLRALLLLVCHFSVTIVADLSNGWGDSIKWMTLEDGQKAAKEENKPLMLIIHKSWCGACKALKPKFAASQEIVDLSSNFVMVNVMDDDEPKGDQYSLDGQYIPRILFYDSEGNVLKDMINKGGNAQYKYFYFDAAGVEASMKRVLEADTKQDSAKQQDEL